MKKSQKSKKQPLIQPDPKQNHVSSKIKKNKGKTKKIQNPVFSPEKLKKSIVTLNVIFESIDSLKLKSVDHRHAIYECYQRSLHFYGKRYSSFISSFETEIKQYGTAIANLENKTYDLFIFDHNLWKQNKDINSIYLSLNIKHKNSIVFYRSNNIEVRLVQPKNPKTIDEIDNIIHDVCSKIETFDMINHFEPTLLTGEILIEQQWTIEYKFGYITFELDDKSIFMYTDILWIEVMNVITELPERIINYERILSSMFSIELFEKYNLKLTREQPKEGIYARINSDIQMKYLMYSRNKEQFWKSYSNEVQQMRSKLLSKYSLL